MTVKWPRGRAGVKTNNKFVMMARPLPPSWAMPRLARGVLACWCAALSGAAAAICEPWCVEPCVALNGNVQIECGGCSADAGHRCFAGAKGWDNWEERSAAFHAASTFQGNCFHGSSQCAPFASRTT